MSSGYGFHPEAYADLDEIREYIAADNPDAADRFIDEIVDSVAALVFMPMWGAAAPILPDDRCASNRFASI